MGWEGVALHGQVTLGDISPGGAGAFTLGDISPGGAGPAVAVLPCVCRHCLDSARVLTQATPAPLPALRRAGKLLDETLAPRGSRV